MYWAGLDGLSDPNLIVQEIAHSLEVREVGSEPLLQSYLKSRAALLVLDNCEHLIRACAQVTEQLRAGCPKLRILATSVEGLGLFNEVLWQVPSLPLPQTTSTLQAGAQAFLLLIDGAPAIQQTRRPATTGTPRRSLYG